MKLKEIRLAHGITQMQLAERLGVQDSAVCQWESGIRRPSVDMILKIAQQLNCTTDELLGVKKPDLAGRTDENDKTQQQKGGKDETENFKREEDNDSGGADILG